jgi:hypothetical protein
LIFIPTLCSDFREIPVLRAPLDVSKRASGP